jgi:hypothetical protein
VHGLQQLAKFDKGGVIGEPMGLSDVSNKEGVNGQGKEGHIMVVQCGTVGQEMMTLDEL